MVEMVIMVEMLKMVEVVIMVVMAMVIQGKLRSPYSQSYFWAEP